MTNGRLSNISPTQNCVKSFIQRDYSLGTMVRFQLNFPDELSDKIERSAFENTVTVLNALFEEAEAASCRTYCQGCCACFTAYLMFLCTESQYEKCLKKIAKYIADQNEKIYIPRGLLLVNPAERGFRVIEIVILDQAILPRA